jgi:hypothetical protein
MLLGPCAYNSLSKRKGCGTFQVANSPAVLLMREIAATLSFGERVVSDSFS